MDVKNLLCEKYYRQILEEEKINILDVNSFCEWDIYNRRLGVNSFLIWDMYNSFLMWDEYNRNTFGCK